VSRIENCQLGDFLDQRGGPRYREQVQDHRDSEILDLP